MTFDTIQQTANAISGSQPLQMAIDEDVIKRWLRLLTMENVTA